MSFTAAVFTSLAVWGGPGPVSAPLLETASVTDTASVSVSESVTTDVLLTASDTASVTLVESGVVVTLEPILTDLMPWGSPAGYRDIGAKDLPGVADLDVTDTASVSATEDPAVAEQLAEVDTSDDAAVTATEGGVSLLQFEGLTTDLAVYGSPGGYRDIGDKPLSTSDQVDFEVFDDGLVSATEDPVDSQFLDTSDTGFVTATEATPTVEVAVAGADTASVSLGETSGLEITGSLSVDVTDTASASAAEAVEILGAPDVSDTAAVSVADTSALDIDVEPSTLTLDLSDTASASAADQVDELLEDPEFIVASDDVAASVSEIFVLETFEGEIPFDGFDELAVSVSESAVVAVVGRATPPRGRIHRVPPPHRRHVH